MASNNTSLMIRLAESLQVDPQQLQKTIQKICFGGQNASPEEFMTLLMTAERLRLNPLLGQIWAFKDRSGLVKPLVSVDGWTQIMNRQETFDGYEIRYSDNLVDVEIFKNVPEWCECTIWLKGRSRPITERVYFSEKAVATSPVWRKSPRLMLHHRALIQAIRFAFAVAGIGDENDGLLIEPGDVRSHTPALSPAEQPKHEVLQATPQVHQPRLTDEAVQSMVAKLNSVGAKTGDWGKCVSYVKQRVANPEQREEILTKLAIAADAANATATQKPSEAQAVVDVPEEIPAEEPESDSEAPEDIPPAPPAPAEGTTDLPF